MPIWEEVGATKSYTQPLDISEAWEQLQFWNL